MADEYYCQRKEGFLEVFRRCVLPCLLLQVLVWPFLFWHVSLLALSVDLLALDCNMEMPSREWTSLPLHLYTEDSCSKMLPLLLFSLRNGNCFVIFLMYKLNYFLIRGNLETIAFLNRKIPELTRLAMTEILHWILVHKVYFCRKWKINVIKTKTFNSLLL